MSQRAIREYDAKKMFHVSQNKVLESYLVESKEDIEKVKKELEKHGDQKWVVKPDQLFGKRGKLGLIGVNLDTEGVISWLGEKYDIKQTIGESEGKLTTFLIEKFVPHEKEYYVAFKTEREHDIVYFSHDGGVEVEENWEKVIAKKVSVLSSLQESDIADMIHESAQKSGVAEEDSSAKKKIISYVMAQYNYFKKYGYVYLEMNPFVFSEGGEIVSLDTVAKVDTCEAWKQSSWSDIARVKPFGSQTHDLEELVEEMDAETGASLKFTTLNIHGRFGLLLGGGGASVATMDKFAGMGLLDQVINYGELSGNPNYWHNKKYIQGLVDILIQSNSKEQKRLCVVGGISNFTNIDVFCKAFVDAVQEKVSELKDAGIKIFVRRGGVNDKKGLARISAFCEKNSISCTLADGDTYITEAMEQLK